jgi:hypothetical protein
MMDSCHLWEDNYFQLLFDDHTPPDEVNIIEGSQELRLYYQFFVCVFSSGSVPSKSITDLFQLYG